MNGIGKIDLPTPDYKPQLDRIERLLDRLAEDVKHVPEPSVDISIDDYEIRDAVDKAVEEALCDPAVAGTIARHAVDAVRKIMAGLMSGAIEDD